MTSSSFSSIFCDDSSDTHSCLLASKLWSLRFPCLEILAAKVEGKPGVTDNYCWTTDHEHREHSLRVPCRLQWGVSSALCEWTWPEKVKHSRCRIDLFFKLFSISSESVRPRHKPIPRWHFLSAVVCFHVCAKSSLVRGTCCYSSQSWAGKIRYKMGCSGWCRHCVWALFLTL